MKSWFKKKNQNEKIVIHEIDFSAENTQAKRTEQQPEPVPVSPSVEPIGKHRKKPNAQPEHDKTENSAGAEGFGLKKLFGFGKKSHTANHTTSPVDKKKTPREDVSHTRVEPALDDVSQLLRWNWWYALSVMGILILVFFSAFVVVKQVYDYRKDLKVYNELMREHEQAKSEWGRLIIEQQTFGATAQIGTRAVTQLKMYSPPISETVVIASEKSPTQSNKP